MWGSFAKFSWAPMAVSSGLAGHGSLSLLHGLDDVLVAGAAAQVAFELLPDLSFAGVRVALAQVQRAHHHARRAEPALQAMAVLERGLHRMQGAVRLGEPLDGGDL